MLYGIQRVLVPRTARRRPSRLQKYYLLGTVYGGTTVPSYRAADFAAVVFFNTITGQVHDLTIGYYDCGWGEEQSTRQFEMRRAALRDGRDISMPLPLLDALNRTYPGISRYAPLEEEPAAPGFRRDIWVYHSIRPGSALCTDSSSPRNPITPFDRH